MISKLTGYFFLYNIGADSDIFPHHLPEDTQNFILNIFRVFKMNFSLKIIFFKHKEKNLNPVTKAVYRDRLFIKQKVQSKSQKEKTPVF